jgi:hypothetical protein
LQVPKAVTHRDAQRPLRLERCARGIQRPAAVIQPRSVSTQKASACSSVSF